MKTIYSVTLTDVNTDTQIVYGFDSLQDAANFHNAALKVHNVSSVETKSLTTLGDKNEPTKSNN